MSNKFGSERGKFFKKLSLTRNDGFAKPHLRYASYLSDSQKRYSEGAEAELEISTQKKMKSKRRKSFQHIYKLFNLVNVRKNYRFYIIFLS